MQEQWKSVECIHSLNAQSILLEFLFNFEARWLSSDSKFVTSSINDMGSRTQGQERQLPSPGKGNK